MRGPVRRRFPIESCGLSWGRFGILRIDMFEEWRGRGVVSDGAGEVRSRVVTEGCPGGLNFASSPRNSRLGLDGWNISDLEIGTVVGDREDRRPGGYALESDWRAMVSARASAGGGLPAATWRGGAVRRPVECPRVASPLCHGDPRGWGLSSRGVVPLADSGRRRGFDRGTRHEHPPHE